MTKTLIVLSGALTLLLSGCGGSDGTAQAQDDAAQQPPPPQIPVADVEQRTIPLFNDHIGNAQAMQAVDIRPKVSGFIDRREFIEGRHVEAGSLLYVIDQAPFQATLDRAQGDLEAEQASLEQLNREVERFRQLVQRGGVSRNDLDDAIAQANESRGRINALTAAVRQAEIDLEYTEIRAPFGGRMERTRVYPGDLVTAQETVLSRIVQLDPIHVVFNVSRAESFQVQQLQRSGTVAADPEDYEVQVLQADGTPYDRQGSIDFVSADIDPLTDTFIVRAVFPNDGIAMLPGQFTQVRVLFGEDPDRLLIEETALAQDQDGYYVLVVDDDNRVVYRKVLVDKTYQGKRVIREGLNPGERVVVEGLQRVRPGQQIDPQPIAAQAATEQASAPAASATN